MILRVTLGAVILGAVLSFIGAFSLDDDPLVLRTAYAMAASLLSASASLAAYQLALFSAWAATRFWARVALAAAFAALPMTVLIWASTLAFGGQLGPAFLPVFYVNTFVVGGLFIAVVVAPAVDNAIRSLEAEPLAQRAPSAAGAPVDFLDLLPHRLRGADLWALKAEDHYLRVVTARGEALLRLRMADALRELKSVEGAQSHRSWWVARGAVAGVKRADGRIALVLPDGAEIPVSRTFAPELRAAGWF